MTIFDSESMNAVIGYTHKIISMERRETQNSKSPMWTCYTDVGLKVNIFKHLDPDKDTFGLFKRAGYGPEMEALAVGQELAWRSHPIAVQMEKVRDWWTVTVVAPRLPEAVPDVPWVPPGDMVLAAAQNQARALLSRQDVVIFDLETTGTAADDEIVSIGIIDTTGGVLLYSRVRPTRRSVDASSAVHGISDDDLVTARTFAELYDQVWDALAGKVWIIYNAAFDVPKLERACLDAGQVPPYRVGEHCAMELFARYHGDWQADRQRYQVKSLGFAAEWLGISNEVAHDALGDCQTTLAVLDAMTGPRPPATTGGIPF